MTTTTTSATVTAPTTTDAPPLRPSKPGPSSDWDDIAADDLRLRRVVQLVTEGHSYRQIAKDLGIAYTTVTRLAPRVSELMNDETRRLAAEWSAIAFQRLERVFERLAPSVMADDAWDPANGRQPAPKPRDVASFAAITKAQIAVLTLSRRVGGFAAEPSPEGESVAEALADNVTEYMKLADKMAHGATKGPNDARSTA